MFHKKIAALALMVTVLTATGVPVFAASKDIPLGSNNHFSDRTNKKRRNRRALLREK